MADQADAPAPASPVPEMDVAVDLARRALPLIPVAVLGGAVGWGVDGAASAGIGLALAVLNLLAAAAIIGWAARTSPRALMPAVLGGFLLRFAVLTGAVVLLRRLDWIEQIPLLFTVLIAHLALLIWETRFVSLSLAYPGLKPRPAKEASSS